MDAETKQALEAMEARIMERLKDVNANVTDVYERVEKVETSLLSAFRDWSTPIEMRLRSLPLIDQRLGLLEERISKLERKDLERGL